ncbi:hypothetical protein [Haloglomus litoreum]|uniref:hypothetical protein n=1 Tax=Haloglomus litoreum TaxID=3034026 RepID=UPI0023E84D90|nr:hypothetical protein [Haloglomus sp. DT116]
MNGPSGRGWGRGQPVQIGVLLLFAFLVIGLALFQAVLVPQENAQVEFNHNQAAQDDMVDLRSDLLRSAATGEGRTTRVRLGTTYPSRTLLLNPAPPGGTLRTVDRGGFNVTNATATTSNGAQNYWNGTTRNFSTNGVVYEPTYNAYDGGPETVLESSVLYNRFESGERLALSNQSFINSRTISLVGVMGEYDTAGSRAAAVDPRVVSATNRTVSVTSEGGPITLRLPTQLSESEWEELLSGEMAATNPDGYVEDVEVRANPAAPGDLVVVTLVQGQSYNLRLGAVGLGSRTAAERATDDVAYVVATRGGGDSLDESDRQQVTVEARDRFNNPVVGTEVTVEQPDTGWVVGDGGGGTATATTDASGQATFEYRAPLNVRQSREVTLNATGPGGDPDDRGDPRTVAVNLTVEDDAERVGNDEYGRPLITAVEPDTSGSGSATAEFVRVYIPTAGEYTLRGPGDSATVTTTGEEVVHFGTVGDDPLPDCRDTTVDASFAVPDQGSLELVRADSGTVRDSHVYEDSDYDERIGLRRVEDGAYVDTNRSADWRAAGRADVCEARAGDQPPTVRSLSASANYAGGGNPGMGGGNPSQTDRVTFTYSATDDLDVPEVTVDATPSGTTTTVLTEPASGPSGTAVIEFDSSVAGDGTSVTATFEDDAGQRVECTGTFDEAGQTLTPAAEGLDCGPP